MTEINRKFDTVVVGLGKTGFACAKYMARQGADFAVTDNRSEPPMLNQMTATLPNVPLYLGKFDNTLLANANNLLISPGVSLQESAIVHASNSVVDIYGDVELFCRNTSVPIIAITGSNGKSTVATLVAEMLRSANFSVIAGGNLGTPVLDMLAMAQPDFYVLELSSFQLETVRSLNAVASVVLNIAPDHMDRYQSMEAYIRTKERIYHGTGTMVINMDDVNVVNMIKEKRGYVGITLSEPITEGYGIHEYDGVSWIVKDKEKLIPINDLHIKGKHNIANAMVAMALARIVHCPLPSILNVLRTFSGLEHRCQPIFKHANITWINDSKGTNVAASCTAIESLSNDKNIILIAGGDGKDADFSPLLRVAKTGLKAAIVLGKDGFKIAEILANTIPVHSVNNIDMAVETAINIAKNGDIVLLSPACSSQDMFVNYQARGEAFISAIKKKLMGKCYV